MIYRKESRESKPETIVEVVPIVEIPQEPGVGKRCYTVEEVQTMLGIGRIAVYNLIKEKKFRTFRIGGGAYRIVKTSFDAWLEGTQQEENFQ